MYSKWEVVHWPSAGQLELSDTKEHAEKLAAVHGKGHIVREIWFYDDDVKYMASRIKERSNGKENFK